MSATESVQSTVVRSQGHRHMSLVPRLGLAVGVLFAEKSALNLLIDFRLADKARGLGFVVRQAQHFGLRFAVSFAVALAFFVYVRGDESLRQVNREARTAPVKPAWLALHIVLLIPVSASLYHLYGNHGIHLPFAMLAGAAAFLMLLAALALLASLAPWQTWRRAAAAVGIRWAYAALAAVIGTGAILWSQELWDPTARLTFQLVSDLLKPILPSLQADATTRILSTPTFAVEISSICSGLEGVGLMLAFCSAWLLYFRAEYRFPRALIIIPIGVLLIFALNVVRIAALVLIGNAGHPAIAVYGFHSQAGWIAFNCVACGVAFASRRSTWMNKVATRRAAEATSNPAAAYLIPFLALLAAGMISRAASGDFETWYALRLVAAAIALTWCWPALTKLDWRFGWRGIGAGVLVFAIWVAISQFVVMPSGMPSPLASMSAAARALWIAGRAITGVLVVPVVEELAYRGYLMRRLVSEDFDGVPFGSVGWVPLAVTATAFGVLHGALWVPGVIAGLIYGAVAIRTGRMGEAVAAHAASNLLIALWPLATGQWQLW